jgi:glycine cleavage system aminomethyltransferase T
VADSPRACVRIVFAVWTSVEDIVVPECCAIFGERLVTGTETSGPWSPTLDRIIPALGYVRGNIWVISRRANAMKRYRQLAEMAGWDDELGAWARPPD